MINKFLEWQKSCGLKDSTIKNYQMYLNPMNNFKPLAEWSNDDAIKYILKLQKASKPSTVEQSKIVMKVFFKWLQKPEAVANIKIKNIKNNLKREDILTLEDIEKMIETTPSPLYKALIAFLFESGARINEALTVKVKNIQDTNRGMEINIPQTKTGDDYRPMLCSLPTATHIRNHITYSDLQPDDILFSLTPGGAWRHLKKIGERAKITKRVYPHAFRHAHATDMVLREYQESIIKKQMGWEPDSKMIGRYQHINNNDVVNAMANKHGIDINKSPIKNLTKPKPLEIANASLKLKKLEDENEELKNKTDTISKDNEFLKGELTKTMRGFEQLGEHFFIALIKSKTISIPEIKNFGEMFGLNEDKIKEIKKYVFENMGEWFGLNEDTIKQIKEDDKIHDLIKANATKDKI